MRIVLTMLVALLACGEVAAPPPRVPTSAPPIPVHATWFAGTTPWTAPPCPGAPPPPRVPGRLLVAFHHGPGVTSEDLQAVAHDLSRFWEPLGLVLAPAGPSEFVPTDAVLTGDGEGTAPKTSLAELDALVSAVGTPATSGRVVVVVLPRIAAEGSWATARFSSLRGLTLSPHQPAVDDAEGARWVAKALGLEEDRDPVILLSRDDLAAQPRALPRIVPAHELGHALGLRHRPGEQHLMAPEPSGCVPGLTEAEAEQVRRVLAVDKAKPK